MVGLFSAGEPRSSVATVDCTRYPATEKKTKNDESMRELREQREGVGGIANLASASRKPFFYYSFLHLT